MLKELKYHIIVWGIIVVFVVLNFGVLGALEVFGTLVWYIIVATFIVATVFLLGYLLSE